MVAAERRADASLPGSVRRRHPGWRPRLLGIPPVLQMQSESFDDHVPATDDGDLAAELAAERAATEHWRRVARQRSADYAQLRHRPLVRAVLGVEWRLAP